DEGMSGYQRHGDLLGEWIESLTRRLGLLMHSPNLRHLVGERDGAGSAAKRRACPSRTSKIATDLVLVAGDRFAVALGAEGPPGRDTDRGLDESDAAVGHRHVHAARVGAGGEHELVVRGLTVGAALHATRAELHLAAAVGRHDRIEEGVAHAAHGPAIASIV